MAIGGLSSSRKLLARRRLQKRASARRILMETLESRQLMAVGPQLLGIQPNSGDLLDNGEILHVSPREFKLRFDDAVGLDVTSLNGIRIIRSGDDGVFERASMATDFGTNGQTLVEFYAQQVGEVGNGITVKFTKANRSDSRLPVVTNSGREVTIQLNSNPALETRVQDLVQVLDPAKTTTATSLIYALRLRGSETAGIATSVDTTRPLTLSGANSGKVTTSFGQSSSLQVRLTATDSGNSGLGISVEVTGRDRGGAGLPIIGVNGKKITVELNTNARFATTVQEFVDALNADSQSRDLVQAALVSGSGSTRLGSLPTSYSPLQLSGVLDIEVVPAYVGLGDNDHEVIVRFAESLPDDKYRIEILGQGTRTLRNQNGEAFNSGVSRSVAFELDLGALIESIVPQPVTRNSAGQLVQQRNQIEVYFNNDDLIDLSQIVSVNGATLSALKAVRSPLYLQNSDTIVFASGAVGSTSAINPNYFQLFHNAGTLTNADDTRFLPNLVRYYPESDRVTLSFSRNLDELTNAANVQLPLGELRLRIGTNEAVPLPPVVVTPATDAADTFAGATNLNPNWTPGASGSQSVLINSAIINTSPYLLDFPGGSDEPGNRQIRMQDNLRLGADTIDGTSVIFYNFQASLGSVGTLTFGNAITEQQKQRVREVFSLYENYLGVRFIESTNLGMTIAVGDMLAITPFPDLPGSSTPGIVEGNRPGSTFFEAGTLRTNNQPATVLDSQDFSDSTLNAYGGPFMRAAMQAIGRLLGLGNADELPSLTVQSDSAVLVPGVGTEIILPGDGDIVHGQYLYRPDSKDIDLYQFSLPIGGKISIEAFAERMSQASLLDTTLSLYQQNAKGGWDQIAVNDDYFSSDSMIELELSKGNYIVGVSASGNSHYDPTISDSGIGGRSEGRYQLRMDFLPPATGVLRDSTGTAFDGDSDGTPGGTYDFWFRPSGPSNTKFVDKSATTTGNGSISTPYKFIKDALTAAVPGDVVRIVGNGGADGKLSTPADNLAYEIGFDTTQGRALPDGSTFDVPKDVAVIIDAGAVLKLRRARIGVGSTSANVDRSAGSLMVLGTPLLLDSAGAVIKDSSGNNVVGDVYLTSVSDTTLGKSANPAVVGSSPAGGDWGGIDFRNRIDASTPARENLEATGQFLNWVTHADIRYGGGQVVVDGQSQVITPIQMVDARPTIAFSKISSSSDAAISATPNSFLESNFESPLEQGSTTFTVDYDRVGPDIHNNRLTGNSLNGLQIRLRTGASTQLEKLTVQARFDDIDVVHLIPENFEIAGTPGGAVQQVVAPSSAVVTLSTQSGGTLADGTYNYRLAFLDSTGAESPASEPSANVTVNGFLGSKTVQLQNLPQGVRRIYRSAANGAGPYTLVTQLPAGVTAYTDTGTSLGTQLSTALPALQSRLDARLAIDAGAVVKLQGSRIDVSFGGQLIAEGTEGLPVVFTSMVDARYGAGGTFDTANRAGSQAANPGDWGGIYVGPTSKASIDHAVVAYGGGTTRIEGGFADFNAVETHQGELRLANSRLELSGTGAAASTDPGRSGRLGNSPGTVFVRGAQPIIVNNVIIDSVGPAMSINVSALNGELVDDFGRSTGVADFYRGRVGNRGAMISANRLENNDINGMIVRGGELTTEGVWDDTDIVHVVQSEIIVPDYHVYGGLRLTSSPTESLVVKLSGTTPTSASNAGFTAKGTPLDNANRIGGSVQLVGNPGYPVILSSIDDCSVGAGFTVGGVAQNDTNNAGFTLNSGLCRAVTPPPPARFADVIVVADESASMEVGQQFTVTMVDEIEKSLLLAGVGTSVTNTNQYGLVGFGDLNRVGRSLPLGPNGQLFGTSAQYAIAASTLTTNGNTEDGYEGIDHALKNYKFRPNAEKFIILVTDEDRDVVNRSLSFQSMRTALSAQGIHFQGILGTNSLTSNADPALALDYRRVAYSEDGSGGYTTSSNGAFGTPPANAGTTIADYANLVFALGGIVGDIDDIEVGGLSTDSFSKAMVDSIVVQASGNQAAVGDWRGVLLDTYSNDRNVAIVNELESPIASAAGSNNTTGKSQFLGSIAPNEKSGDENQRLGFQLQGVLSQPSDVDVYSFRANAGTEVWLDIDRTLNSVDTVIELVDADGRTLALSNDSLAEEANPSLLYKAADLADQTVNPLRKSSTDFYYTSALGTPKDLFSTNPKDAGLRVKLPGENGLNNLYHVRVRSSNLRPGDATSRLWDAAQTGAGLTQGSYQLQIRLSEVDEIPGSSVSYADIRYATNGLSFVGVPGNSPLLGENSEIEITAAGASNNQFANAQNLGNLLQTNRQALSVAGNLNNATDVDWYSFDIDYQKISATGLREYFSTILDMDYADGIGRADTSIYLFNSAGSLILGGLSSNLVDDQAAPGAGSGNSDLSRGSAGGRDPFVGSYELPNGKYFLAITNASQIPAALTTFTDPNSTTPGVRMQPIEGVRLIAEDHIDRVGGSTAVAPVTPVLFSNSSIVNYGLGDVKLYVSQDTGAAFTNLVMVNPFTGQSQAQIGQVNFELQDIAFRDNGELRAFDREIETAPSADDDNLIDYVNINPGTSATTVTSSGGIQTFFQSGANAAAAADDGMNPEAITFANLGQVERGYIVANRRTPAPNNAYFNTRNDINNGVPGLNRPGVQYFTNVLYQFNAASGQAVSNFGPPSSTIGGGDRQGAERFEGAGTQIREQGRIETQPILNGIVTPNLRASTLVAREVTTTNTNGGPVLAIRDGQTFTLQYVVGATTFNAVFEFDLGIDLLLNYDPANGRGIRDGMKFTLDGVDYEFDIGATGVTPGAVAVPLPQLATTRQLVDAISKAVPGSITVSYDSGRLNFSGAGTGTFTELQVAGIVTDLGSTGGVSGGNVQVTVLASDTADTAAFRIEQAINSASILGVSATARGEEVVLKGATVDKSGPLGTSGVAPGGLITGTAVIGSTLYAVSDRGGLYSVQLDGTGTAIDPNGPLLGPVANVGTYVSSAYNLIGIQFTGLVAGPSHASNGTLSQVLFGIDAQGNVHAFNTAGVLQPVFLNGATSISTGIFGATGLAFSTLDYNLWHTSDNRNNDAGHGLPQTSNDSRGATPGNQSLYFGFENPNANGVPDLAAPATPGATFNYNFPGGAAGAVESASFSLAGIGASDLPTLYFTYRLETENQPGTDALRVYASGDDGQWALVATNRSANTNAQTLFDSTSQWRQARVPLDQFAGQQNVRLRIEFSTAGSFGYGLTGGKGPEIRTIAGSKLQDGESLIINGKKFEIEMGSSVLMPSGKAITNGDSISIEGVRYVFTDGSGPAPNPPDIAVPFNATMTSEEVANALKQVLVVNPVPVTVTDVQSEGNDTITRATQSALVGDTIRSILTGNIGDNVTTTDKDVDMVRVELEAGGTFRANIDASSIGSNLDSFLRVFDSEGLPLRRANGSLIEDDNGNGVTDSALSFVAPYSGIYYLGVSGSGNQQYSASVTGRAVTGSTGNYRLTMSFVRNLNPVVSGNRLQLDGAKNVTVPAGSPMTITGALGTTGVPIPITANMTAGQVALVVQKSLAAQFAGGRIEAYAIRSVDTIDLTGLTVGSGGPFGLTTSFAGDSFPFNTFNSSLSAQRNAFEGVYLDDFIIGVAGRGEMVLSAPANTTGFVSNPSTPASSILVGPYQFEIRGGDEYGTPQLGSGIVIDKAVESDSRLAEGLSIRFNSAQTMISGTTFTIGDGTRTLTFEMDDVNDNFSVQPGNIALPFNTKRLNTATGAIVSETAEVIAARFRDIVNSGPIQAQLQISANLSNNDRLGASSATVALIGNASVVVPSTIGTKIISKGKGGENRERPQGQIVVDSARVSSSAAFGISIASTPRDAATTSTGSAPRNTVTINTERLAPGVVVMNSELLFNAAGGISVAGEAIAAGAPAASVPFVRLVNNTIIGGSISLVTSFAPKIYGNQVFDIGDLAFADAVTSYTPIAPDGLPPIAGLDVPANAIGAPDFSGSGEPLPNEGVVSLGRGGRIVLQFTDNLLSGSGDANPDLVVFEVGDSEEVLVEVSSDGSRYTSVGRASAASPTIDLDAFGFNSNSRLAFVRLTDVSNQGATTGASVGADIDAVGALSSVPAEIYTAGGSGVSITNNASATLLNNVIVNSAIGIDVDPSSASSVVGGTTFQRNTANTARSATTGQFASVVSSSIPVFVSAGVGNIYPAPSSPIIDSSIDSLQDRPSLLAVKQPLGIAASPILAPQFDSSGQLRVDDPAVETPFGLGENVFKDRGAQDRADFVGPSVVLLQPADNDISGVDTNSDLSVVELTGKTLKYFDIQLIDGIEPSDPNRGSNVDDLTVTSASVLVYRDNVPLVEGVDYSFGYNNTSGIIRLTPLAGIWRSESVYTVRFLNTKESAIVAKQLFGYTDGDSLDIVDTNGSKTTFEFDLGYFVTVPSADSVVGDIVDGTTFTIDDGTRRVTFEFDNNSAASSSNRVITVASGATKEAIATAIKTAISATSLAVTLTDLGNGVLQIGGSNAVVLLPGTSGLTITGKPGVRPVFGLQIPLQAGLPVGLTDGQTFVIDRSGAPVTFELDFDGTVISGNVPVRLTTGANATQIGNALVSAIQNAGLGLSPAYVGNGLVRLGGDANTRLTLTQTVLTQQGLPGMPAAVPIVLSNLPATTRTAEDIAALIKKAIDSQNLFGITTTQFGGRVVVEGARGVAGAGVGDIVAISDHAGNELKANQVDGSTTVTIFLGEGLDFGDAPDPKYTSLSDNDGPRHTVVTGLSLGLTVTPDADAKVPNADLDDGVTFTQLFSAFNTSFTVTVTNTTGATAYLSYWFDYNANGVFETTEGTQNVSLLQFAVPSAAAPVTLPAFTTLVPSTAAVGTTYARFRLSTSRDAVALPNGAAPDGEVEDFAINVQANPYKNPSNISTVKDAAGNNLDVNADGSVSPIDALQVINYINDPSKPRQLTLPVNQPLPPYVDVNGDGVVSPLDALLVINFLNALRSSGEGESNEISDSLASDSLAYGSGEEVTLSSNWAAGLENILVGSAEKDDAEPAVATADVALMSTQEDEDSAVDFQVQRTMDVNVLDDVLAESGVFDLAPSVSSQGGSIRDQLLASFFRK